MQNILKVFVFFFGYLQNILDFNLLAIFDPHFCYVIHLSLITDPWQIYRKFIDWESRTGSHRNIQSGHGKPEIPVICQWWSWYLFRCRIDLLNLSIGFNIIAPYMEFLHLNCWMMWSSSSYWYFLFLMIWPNIHLWPSSSFPANIFYSYGWVTRENIWVMLSENGNVILWDHDIFVNASHHDKTCI